LEETLDELHICAQFDEAKLDRSFGSSFEGCRQHRLVLGTESGGVEEGLLKRLVGLALERSAQGGG